MPHMTAFIITSVIPAEPRAGPSSQELQKAANEAATISAQAAQRMRDDVNDEPRPETLALGTWQHRFIKGNHEPNSVTFRHLKMADWSDMTHQFWSDRNGQTSEPGNDSPQHIINDSWNTGGELIALALRSKYQDRPIYPSLLIQPDGTVLHELTHHDQDVFGQICTESTAHHYLTGTEPVQAWHMAKWPLEALEEARFRIDYLRALTGHPDNIVFEVDWNL